MHRPTLVLDIGALMDSLVGQTEAALRKALKQIEATNPCVLMIDEVEKAIGTVDDDWTGAEIKACCRLSKLLDVSLREAALNVVPVAHTSAESLKNLRRRASHVEPTTDGRRTADLSPVDGPMLGPFDKRSEAIDAELDWLNLTMSQFDPLDEHLVP